MSSIHLRERRQLTLPSDVVAAAGLQTDDTLEVSYVNGVIQLVPLKSRQRRADMSRFVGAALNCYGGDTDSVNRYLREQRDSW